MPGNKRKMTDEQSTNEIAAELKIIKSMDDPKMQEQFLEVSRMRLNNRGADTSHIDKILNTPVEQRDMIIDSYINGGVPEPGNPEEMSTEEYYNNATERGQL